jgi:uncharacterized membrane protein
MAKTSITQNIFRIALGGALLLAGIGHLSYARKEFQAQVPNWVPMDKDLVVVLSGFVEIAQGMALIFWKKERVRIGWASALFFVLVFPGNIAQYVDRRDAFGLDTDQARFIRLFFQPVLIAWALWSTGAWAARREKLKE